MVSHNKKPKNDVSIVVGGYDSLELGRLLAI